MPPHSVRACPCLRRFDLSYQTEGQKYEQPVMIHRAILGSVERMFAILTEHFAAKWPFWLNPRQVQIFSPGIASEHLGSQLEHVACRTGPQPALRRASCGASTILWPLDMFSL